MTPSHHDVKHMRPLSGEDLFQEPAKKLQSFRAKLRRAGKPLPGESDINADAAPGLGLRSGGGGGGGGARVGSGAAAERNRRCRISTF